MARDGGAYGRIMVQSQAEDVEGYLAEVPEVPEVPEASDVEGPDLLGPALTASRPARPRPTGTVSPQQ